MSSRYQITEVCKKAIHDVFTALELFEEKNKVMADTKNAQNMSKIWFEQYVLMFIKHMAGIEDSMWKYFYLARKLLNRYDNHSLATFRSFINIMYPGRPVNT